MKRKWLSAGVLSLIVFTLVATGCSGTFPESVAPQQIEGASIILSQQNTGLWVTGEGKVSVTPDVAILNLGVEAQAKTVAQAQREAVEAADGW